MLFDTALLSGTVPEMRVDGAVSLKAGHSSNWSIP